LPRQSPPHTGSGAGLGVEAERLTNPAARIAQEEEQGLIPQVPRGVPNKRGIRLGEFLRRQDAQVAMWQARARRYRRRPHPVAPCMWLFRTRRTDARSCPHCRRSRLRGSTKGRI